MRFLLVALIFFSSGFVAGLYSLPIIQAARMDAPIVAGYSSQEDGRRGVFRDDLPGNDFLHWGRGDVHVTERVIAFNNVELAPGPDYRLYLVPQPVVDEEAFLRVKAESVQIAAISTFSGSAQYPVPADVDTRQYPAVLVWCEAFGEFITLAELNN